MSMTSATPAQSFAKIDAGQTKLSCSSRRKTNDHPFTLSFSSSLYPLQSPNNSLTIIILALSMLDFGFLGEDTFSPTLMYSLTAEHFAMNEMAHLCKQTELMERITSRQEKREMRREDEKDVDGNAVDQTRSQLEKSVVEECPPESKVTLFADCKIKRIQEEDEILNEIQKKCSSHCYSKVREMFDSLRQQAKVLKHLEGQIQLNNKITTNLLLFKQENDQLKAELEKARSVLTVKQEQKQKLRALQQRNMNKENVILKNEKNLLMKEKRLVEMKKKVQSITQHVDRQFQLMYNQIEALKTCLKAGKSEWQGRNLKEIVIEKGKTIQQLWREFGVALSSKLQLTS